MSYDLILFDLPPGTDPFAVLAAREQELLHTPKLFRPADRERVRNIANTLRHRNPQFDWQPIASGNFEAIEIDAGEHGNGVQITLFVDEVSVTVPYWYETDAAREVFSEIWDYLRIIQHMTGYAIFDPQIGKTLDLNTDFELPLGAYTNGDELLGDQF